MGTKLDRMAEVARTRPKERFTSLIHLINEEMLIMCHHELDANKAAGIDEVIKSKYEENLRDNVRDLVARMKKTGIQASASKEDIY
ncbi:hypothetical protein [Acetohalobium arabaticum]|uniref:hypothetical protein n=1 Tax=Acetohalobium arabaticum TaxID=28187 RepID=UPI0002F3D114|nr:hypothetical protein [Acetohalobium arabaticum]